MYVYGLRPQHHLRVRKELSRTEDTQSIDGGHWGSASHLKQLHWEQLHWENYIENPTHRCPAAREIGNVINADLVNNVSETWKLCNSPDVDTYALNDCPHVQIQGHRHLDGSRSSRGSSVLNCKQSQCTGRLLALICFRNYICERETMNLKSSSW